MQILSFPSAQNKNKKLYMDYMYALMGLAESAGV